MTRIFSELQRRLFPPLSGRTLCKRHILILFFTKGINILYLIFPLIVNTLNLITHTNGFSSAEPVPFIFSHKEKKDNRAKANPADFPE